MEFIPHPIRYQQRKQINFFWLFWAIDICFADGTFIQELHVLPMHTVVLNCYGKRYMREHPAAEVVWYRNDQPVQLRGEHNIKAMETWPYFNQRKTGDMSQNLPSYTRNLF